MCLVILYIRVFIIYLRVSLSTIVLNSRDRQGMYGMLTIGFSRKTDLNALVQL